jgi:hypothetical protein
MRSKALIRGYGGALGGGKSRTGCEEIFNLCLEHPGIVCLVARDAHTSVVETTKKTMLNQVIPAELIDPRNGGHRKSSQGEDFVRLYNGSTIHFIGMDNPYRWYSSEVGAIFFDESQELVEEDVIRLMNRLRQRCGDCISTNVVECSHMPCRTIITFNPANPGHWLQNWFLLGCVPTDFGVEGVTGAHKDALVFGEADGEEAAPSYGDVDFIFAKATDNPYLSPDYVARLRALPAHMKRRYFDGLWEYHDGSCFFDNEALSEYEKVASSTAPLMTGFLVGDIQQDIAFRLGRTKARPEDPVRVRRDSKGPLVVWQAPVKDGVDKNGDEIRAHRYVVSVDASSGKGEDWTALQVLDVELFDQVAEMQIKIPPEQAAEVAYKLGRVYNDALVVCEITGGWGFAVDQKLRRELKYKNPYTRHVLDRIAKRFTDKAGFDTTSKTRPLILAALEEAIRERELGMYSLRTVSEMGSFVISDNGKPEARPGAHDDLVMALAMAVFVCQEQPKQLRRQRQEPHQPQFAATGW